MQNLTDLRRTGAKGVTLHENGLARDVFVVCKDGQVYAFENCVRTPVELWIGCPINSSTMTAS